MSAVWQRRMRPALGTFVEIGCHAGAPHAIDAAYASIQQVQHLMSFQDPDSELSRLNASDGRWVSLSPLTVRVLRLARAITIASDHRFNLTIGGLLVSQAHLPDHAGRTPLPLGRAQDVEILARRARLRRPVRLTLDGIAKGFAVDLAVRTLLRHGAHDGWVNAGGDLRCFGSATLSIRRRSTMGGFESLVSVRDEAVCTSEASVFAPEFPGRLVTCANARMRSGPVTVIARSAWLADALTKVAAHADTTVTKLARLGGQLMDSTTTGIAA